MSTAVFTVGALALIAFITVNIVLLCRDLVRSFIESVEKDGWSFTLRLWFLALALTCLLVATVARAFGG